MARIRSLKPEIVDDAKLARTSRSARLTFVYLIAQSDNWGYVLAPLRKIAGLLFPHDPDVTLEMVGDWLTELGAVGAIALRETRDGTPVVQLTNFAKHQKLDRRGRNVIGDLLTESVLPAFPFRSDSVPTSSANGADSVPTSFSTSGVGSRDQGIKGPRDQGTEGAEGSRKGFQDPRPEIDLTSPLPEEFEPDFEAAIRSSHRPELLAREIATLARGVNIQAEGCTPEDVGRGLRELLLNGATMGKLPRYVRVAQQMRIAGPIEFEHRDESFADVARRLEAEASEANP